MSRNIRPKLKNINTVYMKTLSKQNTEIQLDFDISSFQTSNNFSKKSSVNATNVNTYTNSNNTSKCCANSKIKKNNHKNYFFSNFTINNIEKKHHSRNRSKILKNNNNSLNKESKTVSQIKKTLKTKELNPHSLKIKPSSSNITKTDFNNTLNTSKNSRIKISKDRNKNIREIRNFSLKKKNIGKNLNISIKRNKSSYMTKKLGSPGINKFIIKTNINSPLDSNRKDKQIITLNNDLINKNNEIINLKKRIDEQDKYIFDLENKIKAIENNRKLNDEEYEQYSKKIILRNIKALTSENEEMLKQIKEYKEKEIKIMRALYYLNKKGISIDDYLD